MLKIENGKLFLQGPKGILAIADNDEITCKLAMLYEGQCEGRPIAQTAQKFGCSRQRYYQILDLFKQQGARTPETVRLIIRYRFLDTQISPEVIAQKLAQAGHKISLRSVERVITEYGLQKKTPFAAKK